MKQVDLLNSQGAPSQFSKLQALLQQLLSGGRAKAQDTLIRLFSSGLSNHYILVRNLMVPEEDPRAAGFQIPCVLIGPSCMLVINPVDQHGFYRAQEDTWLEMAKNSTDYRPAVRNLIQETLAMAERVNGLMRAANLPYPEIQPVLFFANPGMHVENVRPAVRILKFDTVERFLNTLRREEALLDARQVQALVDYLIGVQQAFKLQKIQAERKPKSLNYQDADKVLNSVDAFVRQQHLNRKQWGILGALLIVTILILIVLIMVILFLG